MISLNRATLEGEFVDFCTSKCIYWLTRSVSEHVEAKGDQALAAE